MLMSRAKGPVMGEEPVAIIQTQKWTGVVEWDTEFEKYVALHFNAFIDFIGGTKLDNLSGMMSADAHMTDTVEEAIAWLTAHEHK